MKTLQMKALILAAGHGTRLRPHTRRLPKPLFTIGERPILDILIEQLHCAGCTAVIINTHHLAGRNQPAQVPRNAISVNLTLGIEIHQRRRLSPLIGLGQSSIDGDENDNLGETEFGHDWLNGF